MMNKIFYLIILISMSINAEEIKKLSIQEVLDIMPIDSDVMPCNKSIDITKTTKAVISVTPFRGINLIFPFKLDDDETIYSLSSGSLWTYYPAKGSNVVTIIYNKFDHDKWGTVHDLTIVSHGFTFTLALKADIANHCTNVIFSLSEKERKKMIALEKKLYLEVLKKEHDIAIKNINERAEKIALNLVGALANSSPKTTSIHEENILELSNGDEIVGYVDEIIRYGKFNILNIEIENDSDVNVLYIESIDVKNNKLPIHGVSTFIKKMKSGDDQIITFSTLDNIPESGAELWVKTDKGTLKVTW